ncbi:hypothetical protein [Cohnella cellulosilytica]|uniref:Uncharacterized protein n=1 Tax=Cohnella cellulosilytica TaxID=986710 RepID=A0ABW2F898_9BACL
MIPLWMKLLDVAAILLQTTIMGLYFKSVHKTTAGRSFVITYALCTTVLTLIFILAGASALIKLSVGGLVTVFILRFRGGVGWIRALLSYCLMSIVALGCEAILMLLLYSWLVNVTEFDLRLGAPIAMWPKWPMAAILAIVFPLLSALWRTFVEKQALPLPHMLALLPVSQLFALMTLCSPFFEIDSNFVYQFEAGLTLVMLLVFTVSTAGWFYAMRQTLRHDEMQRENALMNDQLQLQAKHEKELAASRERLLQLRSEMRSQLDSIRSFIPESPEHPAARALINRVYEELDLASSTDEESA